MHINCVYPQFAIWFIVRSRIFKYFPQYSEQFSHSHNIAVCGHRIESIHNNGWIDLLHIVH